MKITAIDTHHLRITNRPPIAKNFPYFDLIVATVRTDEGIEGLGYTLVFGAGAGASIRAYIEDGLKPLLLEQDALPVEAAWERMYRGDRGIRRVGIAAYAVSVLDIALWDIAGKAAGLPLYRLWGAVRDSVPAYGSGGWGGYTEADLVEEALMYVERGCQYYKMKIHDPDPTVNRRRVEAVRRAVGDGIGLMVDVNQKLDLEGNRRQIQAFEGLDLVWYEEPVLADDIEGLVEVAKGSRFPIATGENSHTRYEFGAILEQNAAAYLMPDVGRANGFSETLAIGRMAARYGKRVTPHTLHELSIHVVGTLETGWLVEWIDWVPEGLFEEMPPCVGGSFAIPDRPGHGMRLAAGAVERWSLSG